MLMTTFDVFFCNFEKFVGIFFKFFFHVLPVSAPRVPVQNNFRAICVRCESRCNSFTVTRARKGKRKIKMYL